MIKRLIPFLLFLFILGGCATLNIREQEESIHDIITLINKGENNTLMSISAIPFLFDSEIILLKNDISLIWENLAKAGFSIHDPAVKEIGYIDEEIYALFSPSMEVKTFFKKYIPEKAVLATISSKEGAFYFITGGKRTGPATLFAMKGPVK